MRTVDSCSNDSADDPRVADYRGVSGAGAPAIAESVHRRRPDRRRAADRGRPVDRSVGARERRGATGSRAGAGRHRGACADSTSARPRTSSASPAIDIHRGCLALVERPPAARARRRRWSRARLAVVLEGVGECRQRRRRVSQRGRVRRRCRGAQSHLLQSALPEGDSHVDGRDAARAVRPSRRVAGVADAAARRRIHRWWRCDASCEPSEPLETFALAAASAEAGADRRGRRAGPDAGRRIGGGSPRHAFRLRRPSIRSTSPSRPASRSSA